MNKSERKNFRQNQLIDSTIELILEKGLENTSTIEINANAGLPNRTLHYYFENKENLLDATLRHLSRKINSYTVPRIRTSQTTEETLAVYIEGNFNDKVFQDDMTVVWLTFWARARHSPILQNSHDAMARRTLAGLARGLAKSLPKARAREEALAFTVFVDGLWLRAAVDKGRWSAAEARRLCYQYVERQIGLKIGADIIASVNRSSDGPDQQSSELTFPSARRSASTTRRQ